MSQEILSDEIKTRIDTFLSELHFNVMGEPTSTAITEEYVVKLVVRFVVSLCSAFWSINEIVSYIRNHKLFSGIKAKLT